MKSVLIALIVLSASFTASAYAAEVFTASVTAVLRVTDIRDSNGNQIAPFGDPLVDLNYLSIQGDFDADPLSPSRLQQDVNGEGTASAVGTSEVFTYEDEIGHKRSHRHGHKQGHKHKVKKVVDIAGEPLGNGQLPDSASPLFFPLGAAFGSGGEIKQTAAIYGNAITGLALASVTPASWVFIDNATDHDLTVSFRLDFAFNGFASPALSGEDPSSRVSIRVLDNFAEDLIDPITADTSKEQPFNRAGSVSFDIVVPSLVTDPFLSFQNILFLIEVSGRAED